MTLAMSGLLFIAAAVALARAPPIHPTAGFAAAGAGPATIGARVTPDTAAVARPAT
jgi:hypothetical protein